MHKRRDTDKAVGNLMQWIADSDWADQQAAIFDVHLARAPEWRRAGESAWNWIPNNETAGELPQQGLAVDTFDENERPNPRDGRIARRRLAVHGTIAGAWTSRYPRLAAAHPRQCANSAAERQKVVDWLKYLENHELRRAALNEPYDCGWIWDEPGLTEYRR